MDNIYQKILQDALGSYWEYNFQTKELYFSPEFMLTLGYTPEEASTRELLREKVFSEDAAVSAKMLEDHIASKGEIPYRIQVRYRHKDGHAVWMQCSARIISWTADGQPIQMVGCHFDITKQKEVEVELQRSEEQFRTAFKYSATGMAIVSLEGQWLKVNQKLCDTIGYTEDEMLQKSFMDISHPDDLAMDLELLKKASVENIPNVQREKRYIHKNGAIIWVLLNISVIKNADGTPSHFITQVLDITKRKEQEQELIKTNQELTAFFDSDAHVAIIATDLNGLFTHFSKGAEILLGYAREEVVNKFTPLEIHLPQEVNERSKSVSALFGKPLQGFQALSEVARTGAYDSQRLTFIRKDGTTFPAQVDITAIKDSHGTITGFLAIATDISQILATKEALRLSEQRWQFALEGSGSGVWDWNMVTNEVYYSKKWKNLIGYEDYEIPNTYEAWSSRVHPEDLGRCLKDLELHYNGYTPDYVNEHRMLCKDGTYKWILTRGKVIEWSAENKPVRVMGTHTDISGQKQKEEELNKTLDIVSEQNKRLLNFAYIVSHNLRSHSGNFKLLLDVIEASETKEELEEAIQHLNDIYYSLDETVKNLNEIVKIQTNISKQKEEIYLYQYVEKTTDLLRSEIKLKNIHITNEIDKDLLISYNPAYMESILLNLITNAIKYRHPDRASKITLRTYTIKNRLVLEVTDNGLGIDLSLYGPKLFGMYQTFHGNDDAKGIGLFITKNQVVAMGGIIEVSSEVNKGTSFKVYLS